MTAPVKLNFKIYQGATFKEIIRWESSTKAYAPITAITKAAPMVVTSVAHEIPVGWRTKITNVVGMKEVNSSENYNTVSAVTSDTVTFSDINSLAYNAYISGGVLEYSAPVDLTGYTARMQLRANVDSDTILEELTTQNGKILIDTSGYGIVLLLGAAVTAAYTFSNAVYSLELVSGTGEVTSLLTGNISLIKEVTR